MMKGGELSCYDEAAKNNMQYLNRNFNENCDIGGRSSNSSGNEIEEIEESNHQGDINIGGGYVPASELLEINRGLATIKEGEVEGSLYSFDFHNNSDHAVVYVAVGNSSNGNKISKDSSMDALRWTINHFVEYPSSTIVFLVHIYPETKYIPTPLGMIPVGQVSAEQKESHIAQERGKRRHFLQNFIDACAATKVKVDTILIESDSEAKAILDLIPICNIRRLILGTSKASLKKLKSRKGSGTVDQILLNAPEFCEVKIICEGKEMVELHMFDSPNSPRASTGDSPKPMQSQIQDQNQAQNDQSFGCGCFKSRVMS